MKIKRACLAFALTCLAASACVAQEGNQSRLHIAVAVKNGRLTVDAQNSNFQPSEMFKEKSRVYRDSLGKKGEAETRARLTIEKALFDDLNDLLAMTSQVYWWLLSPEQQELDAQGKLKDPLLELRNLTDTFPNFKEKLKKAIEARGEQFVGQQQKAFQGITGQLVFDPIALETKTALILDSGDDLFNEPPFDAVEGTIDFRVADPVAEAGLEVVLKDAGCGAQSIAKQSDISEQLKPLDGGLWRSAEIRSLLEDFYSNLGYQATITLSQAREPKKRVEVEESPRIARIVFPCSESQLCQDADLLDQAVYLLLPDRAFRAFIRKGRPFVDIMGDSGKAEFKTVVIQQLITDSKPGSCPEPYLNLFRLQTQQLQLGQIGLAVAQSLNVDRSAGGTTFVDLHVQKTTKSGAAGGKAPENVTKSGAPQADSQGMINAHQQAPEQQPGLTPITQLPNSTTPATTEDNANRAAKAPGWEPAERKNFVGGGFEYRPGQGVRVFALYQRSQLFSPQDSFSAKVGGQGSALGTVNYFVDYLFFRKLHRRLSLQLTGSSDTETNRQFAGVKIDERRTGGSARVELELFRDLSGVQLRFFAEGQRKTVELTNPDKTKDKVNLTTLDTGALYFHQTDGSRHPRTVRIEPRIHFGLGAAASEPVFKVFSMRGNWHQKLAGLYELDFTTNAGFATDKTPLFEQPSLGGEESVRGFQRDDAVGQRAWSLQSELWTAVPGLKGSREGIGGYLRRSVRVAAFVDVGAAYKTSFSQPGLRTGPGLGARIIRFPVVIKIDWAYGLGQGIGGSAHGRFYFSLASNLPF
jgi:hemolysin secretion/activation protein ShlB/FhaC/HecB